MRPLLLLLALVPPLASFTAPGDPPGDAEPAEHLLDRIVVAGASVSAGFGLARYTGQPTTFAQVFDAAITAKHGTPHGNSQFLFSIDPEGYGRLMMDEVEDLAPTLVVAIDFPFWFGYGTMPEEDRAARLERGLALLAELDCPVVVGNFPDMSRAAQGLMLQESQVPERDTLVELNAIVKAWTEAAPGRLLVDLAEHIERIHAEVDIPVGSGWKGTRAKELMQPDDLHPTLLGASMIAVMTAEALLSGIDGLPPGDFVLDVERVAERVKAARTPEPAGGEPVHR
jgi:hypothetical protein